MFTTCTLFLLKSLDTNALEAAVGLLVLVLRSFVNVIGMENIGKEIENVIEKENVIETARGTSKPMILFYFVT